MMQEAKSAKARDRAVVPVIHYKTYLIDGLQQGLAQPTPNCGGDPSPSMGGMRGDITDHRDAVRTRIDVNTCRPDEFSALVHAKELAGREHPGIEGRVRRTLPIETCERPSVAAEPTDRPKICILYRCAVR